MTSGVFVFSLVGFLFLPPAAEAGVSGVSFDEQELAASNANAAQISETAASCLQRYWKEHKRFFEENGYSRYYGDRHPKHKTAELRREVLAKILPELGRRARQGDRRAIEELRQREAELENISCIGLAMNCLSEGFKAAGMEPTWKKIYSWLGRPDPEGSPMFYGTDLQKALVDLGWQAIYWNPDISQNEVWDELEKAFNPLQPNKKWNPVWGGHVYRWSLVKKKREYYGVPVQDIQTLVNFGISPPKEFRRAPFFLGTAHAGYHVFPGFKGQVIEAHSMRELKSEDNLEVGPFNPLNQPVNGIERGSGAPRWTRSEHYRSGVIVVPPGFISAKPFEVPPPARDTPPNGTIPPPPESRPDPNTNPSRPPQPLPQPPPRPWWDPFPWRR